MTMSNRGLRPAKLAAPLLAALLALGLFLASGSIATAAGGMIEVVSQETQVRFPGGVTFDVAVEAEASIVEVKLSYRNANGGPWSYTYLDLDPSTSVEASFTLDTSTRTYIPPGSEVEYFYTVRDAADNVIRSESKTVIYTDTRFLWETATIGHLWLLWHDQPLDRVEAVSHQLRSSIGRVEDLLEARLEAPTRGVIYNTRDEASQAFPNLSRTIDNGQIFHGFAFTDWNVFTGVGLRPGLITHEVAHLLLHQVTSSARPRVPAWLDEGFASYVEPGGRPISSRVLKRQRPVDMPLRTMGSIPGRPSAISFFYRKSESVVGHLIETHGEDAFRAFLARLNQGQRVDNALMVTYGFDQDGLERQWLGAPPGETSDQDDGRLFIQVESVILGGLVLLVVAVVTARLLFRRMVARPKPTDQWDYPEDYLP